MKKALLGLLVGAVASWVVPAFDTKACGHEGAYMGLGYTQLFLFSPENQLAAPGTAPQEIRFDSRYGGQLKFGYDFFASRFGIEVPLSFAVQQLNRAENVMVFGADTNMVVHLVETEKGADFYWIMGLGATVVTEGSIKNNTGSAGPNFNFGPGFQYFFAQGRNHVAAVNISVPGKVTLFVGDNLSDRKTTVFAIPIQFGFTYGF